jgi:hypothetical protein
MSLIVMHELSLGANDVQNALPWETATPDNNLAASGEIHEEQ